ncbi:MAG: ribosome maturation factor RimM [Gemmatimonadales bacterium]
MEAPRLLVVGRLRRPHGLKGEMAIFPLTGEPERVFGQGRQLWRLDLAGTVQGEPVTVERSRAYHREWLVKFEGEAVRTTLEGWKGQFVAAPDSELEPPAEGEVYIHELEGFAVRLADGTSMGIVSAAYDLPAGLTLEIQGSKREFLLPYRQEFIRQVDRAGRTLVVMVPEGLAD